MNLEKFCTELNAAAADLNVMVIFDGDADDWNIWLQKWKL